MWKLHELANLVGGTVSPQHALMSIGGASSIGAAQSNDITLVASPKFLAAFESSLAVAAVTTAEIRSSDKPCIQVEDPTAAFAKIVSQFRKPVSRQNIGISPQATISPSAKISEDACVHPGAVIMDNAEIGCGSVIFPNVVVMENCRIGSHVKIFPGSVLYENTVVGDRCILHANCVLGAYGFGYQSHPDGHQLSVQLGNVVVESDVEIGANTTIDRGTFDSTVIGAGTKIDNLVMVGHNCRIGKHNLLCSQVGIAGSCTTGDFVVMGGQVGLADHLDVGDGVSIAAKSGLMHDVSPGQKMFGIPARPAREGMQLQASLGKLPELRKAVRKLEKRIAEVGQQQPGHSKEPSQNQRAA